MSMAGLVASGLGGALTAGLAGIGAGAIGGANSMGESSQTGDSSYGYSGEGYSSSESSSSSWDQIFGSEASAKDIERAKEANELQDKYLLQQMEYNSKEAAVQRAWQEYMSNTSYQRAVQDLYKAGLNPILAAGNYGASTPTGAVASSGLQTAYKAQTFADRIAGSKSHSSSSSYNSESGGGSSHNEASSWNKSEQQATSLAKGIADIAGKVTNSLAKGIDNIFNSNSSARKLVDQGLTK